MSASLILIEYAPFIEELSAKKDIAVIRRLLAISFILVCITLILSTLQSTYAHPLAPDEAGKQVNALATQAATASPGSETTQIETALLAPPDQCAAPCFWQFQPGQNTLRQFKQLALGIFTNVDAAYADPNYVLRGVFDKGVALHTSAGASATLDTTVDYVYIRVEPSAALAASINLAAFAPASLIKKFGNPDNAFLLFNPARPGAYRLILLYGSRNVLYIIRGNFQDGKACLTLAGIDNISLYRFANVAAATQFISLTAGTTGLPPSITQNTHQTLADFSKIAQNPAANCLTVTT